MTHACRAFLPLLLIPLVSCSHRKGNIEDTWPVMGTFAAITVPASEATDLPGYTQAAREVFAQVNEALSVYEPGSDISRLNASGPGATPIQVSADALDVLDRSIGYHTLSRGTFDITVAPLVQLWGFSGGTPPEHQPSAEAIAGALALTGTQHILLDREAGTAAFARPGMRVDLGGIAKGYAVDLAWERLTVLGARRALVNLGGNMRCIGAPSNADTWRIGVRNPFDRSTIVGVIHLPAGMAVATSGNYERFAVIDGERYAHIIDPRTGRPVKGMAGVTVVSQTALEADAMSTALYVLGPDEAGPVVSERENTEALLIPDEHPLRILTTPGMAEWFKPTAAYRDSSRML